MMLLGVEIADRSVLVVGGGAVAERRVGALLMAGAKVTVVAPSFTENLGRWESYGQFTALAREYQPEDMDGAWLVIAATDKPEVNAAVAAEAQARRIWCVDSSHGQGGSARMVAQRALGDLVVGVTSGAAPDPRRSTAVLDQMLSAVEAGAVEARERRTGGGHGNPGGAGPGAADLITVRGRHALAQADVVIADRLGTEELLATVPDGVSVIDVGKQPGHHPVTQEQINDLIVEHARGGQRVVRLKGGDPYVLGRGGEEVHACLAAGVPVEVVPGVTSALSGPLLAGVPVTQRGLTHACLISSGHAGADAAMVEAARAGVTVVLLMAVAALESIVADLLAAGLHPTTPVAIVENASLPAQRVTHAPADSIVAVATERGVTNPAIVVIGDVAAPDLLASDQAATPGDAS